MDEVNGCPSELSVSSDGDMRLFGHLDVRNTGDLRWIVMDKAHHSKMSINSGRNNMYHDTRRVY